VNLNQTLNLVSNGELRGQMDDENEASIGRSGTSGKHFSRDARLGFYASGHDGKMTEKWDLRAGGSKSRSMAGQGTGRGKALLFQPRSRLFSELCQCVSPQASDWKCARWLTQGCELARSPAPLVKSGRCRDDLSIQTIEPVIAARLAGVAGIHSTIEPGGTGFPAGPANERFNAGGLGEAACIVPVRDHQSPRQ